MFVDAEPKLERRSGLGKAMENCKKFKSVIFSPRLKERREYYVYFIEKVGLVKLWRNICEIWRDVT